VHTCCRASTKASEAKSHVCPRLHYAPEMTNTVREGVFHGEHVAFKNPEPLLFNLHRFASFVDLAASLFMGGKMSRLVSGIATRRCGE
jgi:hypothetical protein